MIDIIDQQLVDWVGANFTDAKVKLSVDAEVTKVPTACFHLLQMETAVPVRREGPKPIELTLRYLVTTQGPTPQAAHRLLGEMLIAALQSSEYQVDLTPLETQTWQAFGLPPQPAFRLAVPFVHERPRHEHLIRETVVPSLAPFASVTGVVLGPEDRPVSNARVQISDSSLATQTNRSGEFAFQTTASFIQNRELLVSARGLSQTVPADFSSGAPMLIRFNPQEN